MLYETVEYSWGKREVWQDRKSGLGWNVIFIFLMMIDATIDLLTSSKVNTS